jgi:hypothetical protein
MIVLLAIFCALPMPHTNAQGNGNGSGNANPGRARKKTGGYTLVIVGDYSGTGTSTIATTTVSLSVSLQAPDGSTLALSFTNLPLVNDRFQSATTFNGTAFTLSGRVDLPAATDADQTPAQAITGRLTATLTDATGKGSRLVAIQDAASRGG